MKINRSGQDETCLYNLFRLRKRSLWICWRKACPWRNSRMAAFRGLDGTHAPIVSRSGQGTPRPAQFVGDGNVEEMTRPGIYRG
jgi:hypothetical protein